MTAGAAWGGPPLKEVTYHVESPSLHAPHGEGQELVVPLLSLDILDGLV